MIDSYRNATVATKETAITFERDNAHVTAIIHRFPSGAPMGVTEISPAGAKLLRDWLDHFLTTVSWGTVMICHLHDEDGILIYAFFWEPPTDIIGEPFLPNMFERNGKVFAFKRLYWNDHANRWEARYKQMSVEVAKQN